MSQRSAKKRPLQEVPPKTPTASTPRAGRDGPAPAEIKRSRTRGSLRNESKEDQLCQLGKDPDPSQVSPPVTSTSPSPTPPLTLSFNPAQITIDQFFPQLRDELRSTASVDAAQRDFFTNSLIPTALAPNRPLSDQQLSFLLSQPQPSAANIYHHYLDDLSKEECSPPPSSAQPTSTVRRSTSTSTKASKRTSADRSDHQPPQQPHLATLQRTPHHTIHSLSADHLVAVQNEYRELELDKQTIESHISTLAQLFPIDPMLFPTHLNPHITKQVIPNQKKVYQETDDFNQAQLAYELKLTATLQQFGPIPPELMQMYSTITEATTNHQYLDLNQQVCTLLTKRIQQHDSLTALQEHVKELSLEFSLMQQQLQSVNNLNAVLQDLGHKQTIGLEDIMAVTVEPTPAILQLAPSDHNFNPHYHTIPHLPHHPQPPPGSQVQQLTYDPTCCDGHIITLQRLIPKPKHNPFTLYTESRPPRITRLDQVLPTFSSTSQLTMASCPPHTIDLLPDSSSNTDTADFCISSASTTPTTSFSPSTTITKASLSGYLTPQLATGFLSNPRDSRDYSQYCVDLDTNCDSNANPAFRSPHPSMCAQDDSASISFNDISTTTSTTTTSTTSTSSKTRPLSRLQLQKQKQEEQAKLEQQQLLRQQESQLNPATKNKNHSPQQRAGDSFDFIQMDDKAIALPRYTRIAFADNGINFPRPISVAHAPEDPIVSFVLGKDGLIGMKWTPKAALVKPTVVDDDGDDDFFL